MKYHIIEPEVIVGMGDNTEIDTTQHPPIVSELHIDLEDWLGDDLMENFPCFIVTDALAKGLQNAAFSGFEVAEMELTLAEYFQNNYQLLKALPEFHWLRIQGKAYEDDFGVDDKLNLVISARALEYVSQKFAIKYARIDALNDSKDLFAGL